MGEELVSHFSVSGGGAGGAGLGVLLVFMTSDPSGETVNEIHPHLVTGDETHNNRLHHNTVGLTPIYLLPT